MTTTHFFQGKVIAGQQKARISGYPTANVRLAQEGQYVADGVYAAWVWYQQSVFPAALVVGVEPGKYELHLLDWSGDLYEQEISFQVVQKVADIQHGIEQQPMIKKIERDIKEIRRVLENSKPSFLSV